MVSASRPSMNVLLLCNCLECEVSGDVDDGAGGKKEQFVELFSSAKRMSDCVGIMCRLSDTRVKIVFPNRAAMSFLHISSHALISNESIPPHLLAQQRLLLQIGTQCHHDRHQSQPALS
jgi:hypothetical protein